VTVANFCARRKSVRVTRRSKDNDISNQGFINC
jgi:hypothetical protein